VTIEMLSDDVLLGIFDFYVVQANRIEKWFTLVHVCQRWRTLVLASPHRLNLRLHCTNNFKKRPAMAMLDYFPTLPIVISGYGIFDFSQSRVTMEGTDNIMAALEHRSRIRQITLMNPLDFVLDRFIAMMRESFPALTELELELNDRYTIIPLDSFSGAPHLRSLRLYGVRFPALSNLLVTANNLVNLHLCMIPSSGFISPQEMVSCLSSFTRLEDFRIGFQSSEPFTDPDDDDHYEASQHLPLTRVDLPCLIRLWFGGNSDYLEDFVARINAPLLYVFEIEFANVDFDISPLTEFIDRVKSFKIFDQAEVDFYDESVNVQLSLQNERVERTTLMLKIEPESVGQLSDLDQLLSSALHPLSTPERLEINVDVNFPILWHDALEGTHWLEFLYPFTAVKNLYISYEFATLIASALQNLRRENAIELLPALQNLFVKELRSSEEVQKSIGSFVATRQLSGHPVAVHRWN